MRGRSAVPTCDGCGRQRAETPGMIGVRPGGMTNWLCFDCIDEIKAIADAQRKADGAAPLSEAAE